MTEDEDDCRDALTGREGSGVGLREVLDELATLMVSTRVPPAFFGG